MDSTTEINNISAIPIPKIQVPVLIIGCGPAGASLGAFLASHGITGLMVSRSRSFAHTPRAHYTNLGAMECLRDIGLEEEAIKHGELESEIGSDIRWGNTMCGKEYFRAKSFGSNRHKAGEYWEASPCTYVDLPQTLSEPLLVRYATRNGFSIRFDMEFVSFTDDVATNTVTTLLHDRLTGQKLRVESRFLAGADGSRSKVAEQLGLSFTDKPGGALAINVWYEADLSSEIEGRVGLIHECYGNDQQRPAWGVVGLNRLIKPWKEWLMVIIATPGVETIEATEEEIVQRTKDLIGHDVPDFKLIDISQWKIKEQYADEKVAKDNVFCLGDATHRHPPHSGFGSNTCIQDAYNLAWKMAYVLKGKASLALLSSYSVERQPVAKQIVTRANDSVRTQLQFLATLGVFEPTPEARLAALAQLEANTSEGYAKRQLTKKMVEDIDVLVGCLGSEMNQVYDGKAGAAVHLADEVRDRPPFLGDFDLNYTQSTYPGFRLPHAWLMTSARKGAMISTQDLAGHGRFTLLTGIGGKQIWSDAATKAMEAYAGVEVVCYSIGIGQDYEDVYFMWENKREVEEAGVVLLRPDRFVGWRCHTAEGNCVEKLVKAMGGILGLKSS